MPLRQLLLEYYQLVDNIKKQAFAPIVDYLTKISERFIFVRLKKNFILLVYDEVLNFV